MRHNAERRYLRSLLAVVISISACSGILEVKDPTQILVTDTNDASGAELLRRGALWDLFSVVSDGAWYSGVATDEFIYQEDESFDGGIPIGDELLDRRAGENLHVQSGGIYAAYDLWQSVRGRTAPIAIEKLRNYALPGAREAHVGEMFAVRGHAALRIAEYFCPGFPFHETVSFKQVLGPALSSQQAFEYALAAFDSALSWAGDSSRVANFARVGRGRALLELGRFDDAANAVTNVPTSYVYLAEYGGPDVNAPTNFLASEPDWNDWGIARSVADREGINGLDYVSANDPRVITIQRGTARDGTTLFYVIGKYPTRAAPVVIASGLEARLIEAEAALRKGDASWLTILNDLRATQITPALPALADPGDSDARVDLLFRERAFWLFATGSRLGDLRRLVRLYGRPSESVFPTGAYWRGGQYGPATGLAFDLEERGFVGGGCKGS